MQIQEHLFGKATVENAKRTASRKAIDAVEAGLTALHVKLPGPKTRVSVLYVLELPGGRKVDIVPGSRNRANIVEARTSYPADQRLEGGSHAD